MLLGFGDVRLAAVLGLLLGWYGLPYVLYGAIAGHVLALVVAVATCIHKRKLHMRYSFGPPLIAGALAVVLFHALSRHDPSIDGTRSWALWPMALRRRHAYTARSRASSS